jgi:hypothetical protein
LHRKAGMSLEINMLSGQPWPALTTAFPDDNSGHRADIGRIEWRVTCLEK